MAESFFPLSFADQLSHTRFCLSQCHGFAAVIVVAVCFLLQGEGQSQRERKRDQRTHQDDNGPHAPVPQAVEVIVKSGEVDVVHCEDLPLLHVVNVRVLHVLEKTSQESETRSLITMSWITPSRK